MTHIVESCPLTKLNGGLSRLHSADEDAVSCEKKKTTTFSIVVVQVTTLSLSYDATGHHHISLL